MAKSLQVLIKTASGTIKKTMEPGSSLAIKAEPGVTYQVVDPATKLAPKKLHVKRVDDNLLISTSEEFNPDEVISLNDYYAYPENSLTGMAENGKLQTYEPLSDGSSMQVDVLDSGMESSLAACRA